MVSMEVVKIVKEVNVKLLFFSYLFEVGDLEVLK